MLPGYALLHVDWLAAGLVGLAVEKYDLHAGMEQGESGTEGGGGLRRCVSVREVPPAPLPRPNFSVPRRAKAGQQRTN